MPENIKQNLLYFAYGEHMNEIEMRKVFPDARMVGLSELPDYAICFVGKDGSGRVGIEPKPGAKLPGRVWAISETQADALDEAADCPYFARREVRMVTVGGLTLPVMLYVTVPGQGKGRPGFVAYDMIREAYAEAGLDTSVLLEAALKAAP